MLSSNFIVHNNPETNITKDGDTFILESDEGTMYARAVIVATGTQERKLKIPGEAKYTGRGVSYCAVCDGNLYKNDAIFIRTINRL